jgi:sulfur-carrier protein adenylyltransferase/sulfurtransferase
LSYQPIPQISATELKQQLEGDSTPFLLDVRDPEEWAFCALDNAAKITLMDIQIAAQQVLSRSAKREDTVIAQIPQDREVVVYCHLGSRSVYAIMVLRELGYRADLLLNLEGGIDAWAEDVEPTMPRY